MSKSLGQRSKHPRVGGSCAEIGCEPSRGSAGEPPGRLATTPCRREREPRCWLRETHIRASDFPAGRTGLGARVYRAWKTKNRLPGRCDDGLTKVRHCRSAERALRSTPAIQSGRSAEASSIEPNNTPRL